MSDLTGPCDPWDGDLNADGYGRWGHDLAHRRAWEEHFHTDLPEGMTLDHACHTADVTCPGGRSCPHRACVNPLHMEVVPQAENSKRRWNGKRKEPRHG